MRYFWVGLELVTMVVVEPLSWKHFLQVVLIAATVAILVWKREKLHPQFIIAMALLMLGSALGTITATVRLGPEIAWLLEVGLLLLYAAALVMFIFLWYHNRDAKQETPS